MSGYRARKPLWPYRDFLTDEERNIIALADGARLEWERLNRDRAMITSRAIQRAKYAARAKRNSEA